MKVLRIGPTNLADLLLGACKPSMLALQGDRVPAQWANLALARHLGDQASLVLRPKRALVGDFIKLGDLPLGGIPQKWRYEIN